MATASTPSALPDQERDLWLPPSRMRRYQRTKIIAATLFCLIFVSWLIAQWNDPTVWVICVALMGATVWVTTLTVVRDAQQIRDRQIAVRQGLLEITCETDHSTIELSSISRVVWRDKPSPSHDDPDSGLSFYDSAGHTLGRLDLFFLPDQNEARNFIGWLRRRVDLACKIEWPDAQ